MLQSIEDTVRSKLNRIDKCKLISRANWWINGGSGTVIICNKKLSRGTARCVVSIEILPIATQQCRNYLYDKS